MFQDLYVLKKVFYAFIWPKIQQNINIVKYYNLK